MSEQRERSGRDEEAEGRELRVEVEGRAITLRDETVVKIGRDVRGGIVVGGDSVSRVHAELRRTGTTWTLVDLGSLNGTFIDGQRIGQQNISAPLTVHLGLPETGTTLVIDAVPLPRVDDAVDAGMSAAYAETMVADAIVDPDQGDAPQPTGSELDEEARPAGPDLIVRVGTARVQFQHTAAVSVGRMPDNDVVIADPACSRIHGYIEPTVDSWMYRNVSQNGTFHRDEPIETISLEDLPIVLRLGHPDTGPRLELAHRDMNPLVSEPMDSGQVIEVGNRRISRRLVYGVVVIALYLVAAAFAVTYLDR